MKKVVVIGAGVMGSMIAEHIGFCGTKVLLLDMVPESVNKGDRNILAKNAIGRMRFAKGMVEAGNLEDDLDQLKDADWVIEVVVEDIGIKQDLYRKILPHCAPETVISSNTSTILRKTLITGMGENFAERFIITHFFNPPRHLILMEAVTAKRTPRINQVLDFCDLTLGRYIVCCNDTCGFIGNRIGCYWLLVALNTAIEMGIDIEAADSVMANPRLGIPRTGVFGLLDLIGLDVFRSIVELLKQSLPAEDDMHNHEVPQLIADMINDGSAGNKTKAGFYRSIAKTDCKVKQAIDLKTGLYRDAKTVQPILTKNLADLLASPEQACLYAKKVWVATLTYVAKLVPAISDNIYEIDVAMHLGYNWRYGPFQLMNDIYSASNLLPKQESALLSHDKPPFEGNKQLNHNGEYQEIVLKEGFLSVTDIRRFNNNTPLLTNASASLWNMGDGIACFSFTSKNNCFDQSMLRLINDAINIVSKHFSGLVIANDAINFSVGANLNIFIRRPLEYTKDIIAYGQEIFAGLKFAPFPVIVALSGFAVGGGCELTLHCDAIQAYRVTQLGLVETNIGLIPGWGGCKEMLLRYQNGNYEQLFKQIFYAQLSSEAEELRTMQVLRTQDNISNNRGRLLHDAKVRILQMLKDGYTPPKAATIEISPKKVALSEEATEHDRLIANSLHSVLSSDGEEESQVLQKESTYFMKLLSSAKTQERITHMLYKKSKLSN